VRGTSPLRRSAQARAEAGAHPARASWLVYLALWFAVVAWGGSFVAARILLRTTDRGQVALSPTVLAAARFSLASLVFVVPLGRALWRRELAWRDLPRLALLGQVAYSIYFWRPGSDQPVATLNIGDQINGVDVLPGFTYPLARLFA
jgi:hypothetical protein